MTSQTLALHLARRVRYVDRVLLAALLLMLLLVALVPAQALATLSFTAQALIDIAPFLVMSVLVAAIAKATGADQQIAAVFSGRQGRVIIVAAIFGSLSPFCSCGVIPIIAALLRAGVPLAPVMAFWISSPLMSPEMFILMSAEFAFPFVIAKTLAALFMGLAAGFAMHALAHQSVLANPLKVMTSGCGSSCGGPSLGARVEVKWKFWQESARREVFFSESRATGWFLLKWLTLAFMVESLMIAYIPAHTISTWLGGEQWWAIPASALVGIPAYLNGYAAIPTVSALINMGMAQGAALSFMLAGGVTSIPAAMAVFALVKRRVFALYLLFGLGGSMLAGLVYQAVIAL